MTPLETLVDRHGVTETARLLDWARSTVYNKLKGKSPIYQDDELAMRQLLKKKGQ